MQFSLTPHRETPRNSIRSIKDCTSLKNADTAMKVLEKVWKLMDVRDERSWDWRRIADDIGLDFLAT